MRGFTKLPDNYFDKFKDKPVKIVPFNSKSRIIANKYISKIKDVLSDVDVEILHRGSTAFGIAGKGDIEIGIYPSSNDWDKVINKLKKHFGKVNNLEDNYARFNDIFVGFEIEVILMKGFDAKVDKKLTKYLINSPKILEEYEKLKYKYSSSKKEYMIQKNKFLESIVKKLQ